MKKPVFGIIFLFHFIVNLPAQVYNNPGDTITTCSGSFFDTGDSSGNYSSGDTIVTTFCSSIPNGCIQVSFTSFSLELNKDFLSIYDGPSASAGLIGSYTFINSPGIVTSSAGCLTFKFISDTVTTKPGWKATLSCTSNCSAPVLSNPGGTTSLCSGTFYDSGGGKGSLHNYGNNENTVTTFCSSIPDSCISVSFTSFSIENDKDLLSIYDGPTTSSGLMGSYSFINSPGTVTSSSGCLTFKFTSDSSTINTGWIASIRCVSSCAPPTYANPGGTTSFCSGNFYDSGGGTGPAHNYSNNENVITTFCSDQPANQIQVAFSSFSVELNKDFMKVYDGPNTASTLLGTYTFIGSPGSVTSTAGCLTFHFTSDSATIKPGWVAAISCPGAVGVYDASGVSSGIHFVLNNIPATTELTGEIITSENSKVKLEIIDLQGRVVEDQQLHTGQTSQPFIFDLSLMTKGVYLIRARNGTRSVQKLFIKM